MEKTYTYYAFISYKREDEKWAKWLQHKLEYYKIPLSVRKNNSSIPEKIRPVFKDTTDLSGGVLEKAINEALESAKYLIVICSPRAAQSQWVCKEVQKFIDLGREEYIIPFIINGTPNSKDMDECFPSALRTLVGNRELLGININENGRESAAVKVIARMFGIQFDVLWQRYQKAENRKRLITTAILVTLLILSISVANVLEKKNAELIIANEKVLKERDGMLLAQSRAVAKYADELTESGDILPALQILQEVMSSKDNPRPYSQEAERSLRTALLKYYSDEYKSIININLDDYTNPTPRFSTSGDIFAIPSKSNGIDLYRTNNGEKIKHIDFDKEKMQSWCFTEDDAFIIVKGTNSFYKINIQTGKELILSTKDKINCSDEDEIDIAKRLNLGSGKQNILIPLLLKRLKIEGQVLSVSNNLKWIIYTKESDSPCKFLFTYLYNVETNSEFEIQKIEWDNPNLIADAEFSSDNSEYAYITYNGQVYRATLNAPLDKITTPYTQEYGGGIYNRIGYQNSSKRIYAYSDRWGIPVPIFYEVKGNILERHLSVNSETNYQNIIMHPKNDNIFIASNRGKYQIFLRSTGSPFFTKIKKKELLLQKPDSLRISQDGYYDIDNYHLEYNKSTISVYDSKKQLIWSQGDCSDIRISPDKKLLLYNVFISPNDYSVIKYISTGLDYLGDFYSIYDEKYEMQDAYFSSSNHIIVSGTYNDCYYDFLLLDNEQMLSIAKELTKGRVLTEQDKKRFFLL